MPLAGGSRAPTTAIANTGQGVHCKKKPLFCSVGVGLHFPKAPLAPLKKGSDSSPTTRAQHRLRGHAEQHRGKGKPRVDADTNRQADGQKTLYLKKLRVKLLISPASEPMKI